jgi:hypothetical protein
VNVSDPQQGMHVEFYSRHVITYVTSDKVDAFSTRTTEERLRLWGMFTGPPADAMLDKFGADGVVQWIGKGGEAIATDGDAKVGGWEMGEGSIRGHGQPLATITFTSESGGGGAN